MKLSVVIVSCNVGEMLRHTLNALIKSGKNIDYEVFIADNNSTDETVEMIYNDYPQFHVIANHKKTGYSKLCNEAISLASGEYILIVNPAILTSAKTLEHAIDFMDVHTDSGALGVRMITPQGRFLPESNRGLNGTWINFFKLTGLAKFFPKSRLQDRNRKDWVEEFQTSEVDFVSGAFMFLRRAALIETGLLDEQFYDCGYDIDLSYRLRLAGFKNYYYPKTYIINPGEHNRSFQFSWQNLKHYYGAMIIFACKYLFKMPEIKVAGIPKMPLLYEVEG